jgi:hypothetical protein
VSTASTFSGTASQLCRCEEKYSFAGGTNVGSAKQPTGTPNTPGRTSQRLKTVVPHVGQKNESSHLPESAIRRHLRWSPLMPTTADSEKKAVYVKALPESLWHAKQLQA